MNIKPLSSFDYILIQVSGGKDSLDCVTVILDELEEEGINPRTKGPIVELWHQPVDGREHHRHPYLGKHLDSLPSVRSMYDDKSCLLWDWAYTEAYLEKLASSLRLPLYFQWRVGGFLRELLKTETRTTGVRFEVPTQEFTPRTYADQCLGGHGNRLVDVWESGGTRGSIDTQMQFPQISPDLRVRWCSRVLKIDAHASAISGQERFTGKRILVVSGERREESPARSKYKEVEYHRRHSGKRECIIWRPVIDHAEEEVWERLSGKHRGWGIRPPPSYYIGFGRKSCRTCIFGNANQQASARVVDPLNYQRLVELEQLFGKTLARDGKTTLAMLADKGTPYLMRKKHLAMARSSHYNLPIVIPPEQWELPSGAYGENDGPM